MSHPALDKFGELIVNSLRDNAIEYYDRLAKGEWKAPNLEQLQSDLATLNDEQRDIVRRCVIGAVDTALHDVLFGISEAHDMESGIEVIVDGENIVELSDGLNGEQFTDDGWIARFGVYSEDGTPVERDESEE